MTDPSPPIRCHGLTVGYDGVPVLEDVSFTINAGDTMALVGPSGSGKTTVLKTLAGILPPFQGEAIVLGHRLPATPPAGSVGYIPQRLGLVPHEPVQKNVLHGRLAELGRMRSFLGTFPAAAVEDAVTAIDQVGLSGLEHKRVKELSGGQQRRVAIARAFLQEPQVLLADEMLSELDQDTTESIVRCLTTLKAETGMTVVMVEHNLTVAHEIADVVLSVSEDGVVEAATADTKWNRGCDG